MSALWSVFVDDGAAYAAALDDHVDTLVRLAAQRERLPGSRLTALGDEAHRLAQVALFMGAEDVALLALACERAADLLGLGERDAPATLPSLAAASNALVAAFRALAHPDASGARTEREPLDGARADLERAMAGAPADSRPDSATHRSAVAAARSAAATAVSAAAAIAASAAAHALSPALVSPATGDEPEPAGEAELWTPNVDEDMVELFFEEATERLESLAGKLLELESRPGDSELIRDVFRDLHTLKGSSAMVALAPMNRVAHAAEDLVGQVREGSHPADRPTIDALLAALDALRAIADTARERRPLRFEHGRLFARLRDPVGRAAEDRAEDERVDKAAPVAAALAQAAPRPGAPTLRVDFAKLDLLMNLVGELVLGKSSLRAGVAGLGSLGRALESERRLARRGLSQRAADPSSTALRRTHDELSRLSRVFQEVATDLDGASGRLDHVASELRDQVMKLRMVPVGGLFRKFQRSLRDLAHSLGKEIHLELGGEDTELDKVLVEQLEEPLLHLVRNSVDHGIEAAEKRAAAGKPAHGTIRLSAFHRGNQIVIQIVDDGGGIDADKLRRSAVDKGLLSQEEAEDLDERGALDLIFRSGFSTAARISEVSGRGVGMDVVKNTIVGRLKGEIDVRSAVGQGTTITLRLPLTLAIIQVLLLRAGGEVLALPLDSVSRTLSVPASEIHVVADRELLAVAGRQVPLVRLADVLGLAGEHDAPAEQLAVALVEVLGQPYGILADRLLGKQEIVIKTLGDLLDHVPCAAGATLLADRVALIIDVAALVERALATAAPRRPASKLAPAAHRPRVLVVEDSDVIREAIRRMLEAAGYEVAEARDGVEGLELAESRLFDLVSTDVMMPRMDGYELTRALRAGSYKDTPIIMVTSRGEKIDRVRGFDAGVDEYITKPHDRQELLRAVARQLAAHRRQGGAA